MHRPSGCPSCAEPLEEGDLFCGVCGYALSADPPPPDDHPTVALTPPGRAAVRPDFPPSAGTPEPSGPAGWSDASHVAGPAPAPALYPPGQTAASGSGSASGSRAGAAAGNAGYGAGWSATAGATAPVPTLVDEPAGWGAAAPDGATTDHPGSGATAAAGTAAVPAAGSPAPAAGTGPGGEPTGKTCVACRAGRVDTDGYCEHCGHAQPRERDHLEEELGSVAAVSDRGLRHHRNEDSFAVAATALPDGSAATVAIVCDGVSSASRPDEASAAAAVAANEALLDALPRGALPQQAMHEAILAAATAVNALAPEVPGAQNAPACTLVGAVTAGGLLIIGWVGDSRAYWVPDDRSAPPARLTEDDSWAAQMVAAGLMNEAEAYADARAHAITGWLGADAYELEPHTVAFKPDRPGVVVVCTDGLWNYAESAQDMARVLPADAAARPLHSAQVLVGHALDGGGHDNVTVAVVPFAVPEAAAAPAA
ncbi:PP2C family protein-serine/threonine phosphatase [Streptomyces sp. NPDC051555]|uniref:PP2C family protein-serine/threonine phosphatase n=1 Tax=Streptomyces sp. NPDC051555 TaxID=3365657 RepID=UPI0037B3E11F